MVLLGVDVGGTFTDAVLLSAGTLHSAKTPTTPDDESVGVLNAVTAVLAAAGHTHVEVNVFAHGMTVATNALLEGRHARTALIATEGFTDLIELGRQTRADLYRLRAARPAPLVPADRRFGAPERMIPSGVLRPLSERDARELADAVADTGSEAVAVCLLHSYAHPEHELMVGEALARALPGVHVSLSHEVVGTFREYERAATTEIDAALSPLLARYLERLTAGAQAAGLPAPLIMQSSGGVTDAATAGAHAALTVLSGPAGGAAAAARIADQTGRRDLVCLDMGGTSCDVCVVQDGVVAEAAGREVAGRPIALPMADIHTVGAGGGSIAWADPGGALRVGPRSAGAAPGPACYGRGGAEPTVTDANLVLGRLDESTPLAGGLRLDLEAAVRSIGELAQTLGLTIAACAEGVVAVAEAEMVRAVRVMTVERGVDPRGFALLAFGGAGPLHACAVAEALGMDTVLVPAASGVLSALGLAAAEHRTDTARTVLLRGAAITAAALAPQHPGSELAFEVRYQGQAHELTVRSVAPEPAALRAAFEALHQERYGHTEPDGTIEVVTIRERLITAGPAVDLLPLAVVTGLRGPAVLPMTETTVWIPAGWRGETDDTGTLILERTR